MNWYWWWISCLAAIVGLTITIYYELTRIRNGTLFRFALAGESDATQSELVDAQDTANTFLIPALLCPAFFGLAFAVGVPALRSRICFRAVPWWLCIALIGACAADLFTTMRFFQTAGVDHELHPGIRLFGYAYGRSVGPFVGKVVQLVGLLALAVVIGRWGVYLITAATVLFLSAAIYNSLQT